MYLEASELADLNKLVLERSRFIGDRAFEVKNWTDLERASALVRENHSDDPFKQGALLCCALIAYHPFADGNHRTSLYAAVYHLFLHGYVYTASQSEERSVYEWRYEFEEEHNLEATWAWELGGWDEPERARAYLHQFACSEYGQYIEEFLKRHCEPMPLERYFALLPPEVANRILPRYPKPFRKAVRRIRRTNASWLRKTWQALRTDAQKQHDRPPRQEPWGSR